MGAAMAGGTPMVFFAVCFAFGVDMTNLESKKWLRKTETNHDNRTQTLRTVHRFTDSQILAKEMEPKSLTDSRVNSRPFHAYSRVIHGTGAVMFTRGRRRVNTMAVPS